MDPYQGVRVRVSVFILFTIFLNFSGNVWIFAKNNQLYIKKVAGI